MIIQLDFENDIPIYIQIRNEVVRGIGKGEIQDGELLPTVRSLACDIGVNPMTVNKAYGLLKTEGLIMADRRLGARVCLTKERREGFVHDLEQRLQLLTAEAVIKGYGEKDFLELCKKTYRTMKRQTQMLKEGATESI